MERAGGTRLSHSSERFRQASRFFNRARTGGQSGSHEPVGKPPQARAGARRPPRERHFGRAGDSDLAAKHPKFGVAGRPVRAGSVPAGPLRGLESRRPRGASDTRALSLIQVGQAAISAGARSVPPLCLARPGLAAQFPPGIRCGHGRPAAASSARRTRRPGSRVRNDAQVALPRATAPLSARAECRQAPAPRRCARQRCDPFSGAAPRGRTYRIHAAKSVWGHAANMGFTRQRLYIPPPPHPTLALMWAEFALFPSRGDG